MEWEDLMVDGAAPPLIPTEQITAALTLPIQALTAVTATAPAALKLIPTPRTASTLDLPLRLLATTTQAALAGAAQDLTDLLTPSTPAPDKDQEPAPGDSATEQDLPPLQAGFYLYRDVALGALHILGPLLGRQHQPTAPAHDTH
ncbi:hypothetical protein ACFYPB_40345 [Streptomyces olivaceoviridis]|uniref:hypothetical protein n=1 Tax=Streptomyces olivaceoviridis TaxID=1921 RepID=UPI00368B1A5A